MSIVTRNFSSSQLGFVHQAASADEVANSCPENFNLLSECFAAIVFNVIPETATSNTPLNYTIRADGGLVAVDVGRHRSDYEKRILPLQWAVDSAIIELRTGRLCDFLSQRYADVIACHRCQVPSTFRMALYAGIKRGSDAKNPNRYVLSSVDVFPVLIHHSVYPAYVHGIQDLLVIALLVILRSLASSH